ncbi:hypothetical protein L289_0191 [Acinetobacter gerneri DSM 14967 = CIP 107464 = MTCC 9824]|nr:hypothetical protein L289_0191 [Acinetobacter gerneri DSM 14967 = CIP 107464 = MTCC 9824]
MLALCRFESFLCLHFLINFLCQCVKNELAQQDKMNFEK